MGSDVTANDTPAPAPMPKELSDALERVSDSRRHTAAHGWSTVEAEARQHYSDIIEAAAFEWTSRWRCRYVVGQLVKAATKRP